MKNIIVILFILIILCMSCGRTEPSLRIALTEKFKDTLFLKGEKANIEDPEIHVPFIYDSLGIFTLDRLCPYAYRIYNIRTGKKLGDILMRGRGKGEFIDPVMTPQSPFSEGDCIKMWIKNYPSKLALINVTRSLETGKTVVDKEYDFIRPGKANRLYESNAVFVLKDGTLLMNVSLSRARNAEYTSSSPHYIIYNYEEDKVLDTLYYQYPLQMKQFMSKDETKIISHSYSDNLVSIYDVPSKTETVLMHDHRQPAQVYSPMNPASKVPDYTYNWCIVTTDRLITLYCKNETGTFWEEGDKTYVHIFDLKGNALYNLILDESIQIISLDESTSRLYGRDLEDQWYVYNLKNILR